MVARIWLLGLAVLGRRADRARGRRSPPAVLAVALFTIFFVTLLIVKPLEEAARR